MKKLLLLTLTFFSFIPITSEMSSIINIKVKQTKNHNKKKNNNNHINQINTDDSKVINNLLPDWNNIYQKSINIIDNPEADKLGLGQVFKSLNNSKKELTDKQKDTAKQKMKEISTTFQNKNYNVEQAKEYLEKNNKDYLNSPDTYLKSLKEKEIYIKTKYFTGNNIDLELNSQHTYSDALTKLKAQIEKEILPKKIKITFDEPTQANKKLVDLSTTEKINNFINNNLNATVNIQFGNEEQEKRIINLGNIQIADNDEESKTEILSYYLNETNAQNLKLNALSAKKEAIENLNKKIKARFSKLKMEYIDLEINNSNKKSDYFNDDENLKSVFDEDMNFGVTLKNKLLKKTINKNLYLKNIQFDFTTMGNALDRLFGTITSSQKNQERLGLTTDNTFQDAVNIFNEKLDRISSDKKFYATLINNDQANKKLQTAYNPAKKDCFFLDLNIGFFVEKHFYNYLTTKIYLSGVKLDQGSQETLNEYNKFTEHIALLKQWKISLDILSCIAIVVAAGLWTATYLTAGATISYAVAASLISAVICVADGAVGLMIYTTDKEMSRWSRIILGVASIRKLARFIYDIFTPIFISSTAELTLWTWAVPTALAGISVITTVYGVVSYITK